MTAPASKRVERSIRPRYARLGLLGLGLIAIALTIFAALVVFMFPDEAAFIMPLWVAAVTATAVVWRFDATWARIVGSVVALALGVMMFWVAFGLMHPSSFFDFVPGVLFVLGVALALFGNIAGIVQKRRQHLDPQAGPTERRAAEAVIGLVVVAVVVSGALTVFGQSTVEESDAVGATPLSMTDFVFDPVSVEANGGDQLLVRNDDPFVHDVAVPAIDLDPVVVSPGSSVLIEVPDVQGTFVMYCTLHSDVTDTAPDPEEQMVATLAVR